MKLTKVPLFLLLILLNDVQSAPSNSTDSLTNGESVQISRLVSDLRVYNTEAGTTEIEKRNVAIVSIDDLTTRSNIPILDEILAALKETGLANVVIEAVLLSPTLRGISINATIKLLKGNFNLTGLLVSLQKSGLILSFLNLALDDPEILPGMLRIGKELFKVHSGTVAKRYDMDLVEQSSEYTLSKRENDLITELLTALNDSGLAMAVVQNLLTNPELSEPAAIFLSAILKSGAITIREVLVSVKESHLIFGLLRQILADKALLEKFGHLISDRIARGVFTQQYYDSC
ncbi:hypothetical protein CAAN1_01S11386 [[Candida] anglica]|uniref:Uncharacterized protein n=1 Tax=[Candida] anglica TaxID=148631 RepID=A0ABP0EKC7_9ASCO